MLQQYHLVCISEEFLCRNNLAGLNKRTLVSILLTAAEFALFFEGADLEKRFVESPREMKKSAFLVRHELSETSTSADQPGVSVPLYLIILAYSIFSVRHCVKVVRCGSEDESRMLLQCCTRYLC